MDSKTSPPLSSAEASDARGEQPAVASEGLFEQLYTFAFGSDTESVSSNPDDHTVGGRHRGQSQPVHTSGLERAVKVDKDKNKQVAEQGFVFNDEQHSDAAGDGEPSAADVYPTTEDSRQRTQSLPVQKRQHRSGVKRAVSVVKMDVAKEVVEQGFVFDDEEDGASADEGEPSLPEAAAELPLTEDSESSRGQRTQSLPGQERPRQSGVKRAVSVVKMDVSKEVVEQGFVFDDEEDAADEGEPSLPEAAAEMPPTTEDSESSRGQRTQSLPGQERPRRSGVKRAVSVVKMDVSKEVVEQGFVFDDEEDAAGYDNATSVSSQEGGERPPTQGRTSSPRQQGPEPTSVKRATTVKVAPQLDGVVEQGFSFDDERDSSLGKDDCDDFQTPRSAFLTPESTFQTPVSALPKGLSTPTTEHGTEEEVEKEEEEDTASELHTPDASLVHGGSSFERSAFDASSQESCSLSKVEDRLGSHLLPWDSAMDPSKGTITGAMTADSWQLAEQRKAATALEQANLTEGLSNIGPQRLEYTGTENCSDPSPVLSVSSLSEEPLMSPPACELDSVPVDTPELQGTPSVFVNTLREGSITVSSTDEEVALWRSIYLEAKVLLLWKEYVRQCQEKLSMTSAAINLWTSCMLASTWHVLLRHSNRARKKRGLQTRGETWGASRSLSRALAAWVGQHPSEVARSILIGKALRWERKRNMLNVFQPWLELTREAVKDQANLQDNGEGASEAPRKQTADDISEMVMAAVASASAAADKEEEEGGDDVAHEMVRRRTTVVVRDMVSAAISTAVAETEGAADEAAGDDGEGASKAPRKHTAAVVSEVVMAAVASASAAADKEEEEGGDGVAHEMVRRRTTVVVRDMVSAAISAAVAETEGAADVAAGADGEGASEAPRKHTAAVVSEMVMAAVASASAAADKEEEEGGDGVAHEMVRRRTTVVVRDMVSAAISAAVAETEGAADEAAGVDGEGESEAPRKHTAAVVSEMVMAAVASASAAADKEEEEGGDGVAHEMVRRRTTVVVRDMVSAAISAAVAETEGAADEAAGADGEGASEAPRKHTAAVVSEMVMAAVASASAAADKEEEEGGDGVAHEMVRRRTTVVVRDMVSAAISAAVAETEGAADEAAGVDGEGASEAPRKHTAAVVSEMVMAAVASASAAADKEEEEGGDGVAHEMVRRRTTVVVRDMVSAAISAAVAETEGAADEAAGVDGEGASEAPRKHTAAVVSEMVMAAVASASAAADKEEEEGGDGVAHEMVRRRTTVVVRDMVSAAISAAMAETEGAADEAAGADGEGPSEAPRKHTAAVVSEMVMAAVASASAAADKEEEEGGDGVAHEMVRRRTTVVVRDMVSAAISAAVAETEGAADEAAGVDGEGASEAPRKHTAAVVSEMVMAAVASASAAADKEEEEGGDGVAHEMVRRRTTVVVRDMVSAAISAAVAETEGAADEAAGVDGEGASEAPRKHTAAVVSEMVMAAVASASAAADKEEEEGGDGVAHEMVRRRTTVVVRDMVSAAISAAVAETEGAADEAAGVDGEGESEAPRKHTAAVVSEMVMAAVASASAAADKEEEEGGDGVAHEMVRRRTTVVVRDMVSAAISAAVAETEGTADEAAGDDGEGASEAPRKHTAAVVSEMVISGMSSEVAEPDTDQGEARLPPVECQFVETLALCDLPSKHTAAVVSEADTRYVVSDAATAVDDSVEFKAEKFIIKASNSKPTAALVGDSASTILCKMETDIGSAHDAAELLEAPRKHTASVVFEMVRDAFSVPDASDEPPKSSGNIPDEMVLTASSTPGSDGSGFRAATKLSDRPADDSSKSPTLSPTRGTDGGACALDRALAAADALAVRNAEYAGALTTAFVFRQWAQRSCKKRAYTVQGMFRELQLVDKAQRSHVKAKARVLQAWCQLADRRRARRANALQHKVEVHAWLLRSRRGLLQRGLRMWAKRVAHGRGVRCKGKQLAALRTHARVGVSVRCWMMVSSVGAAKQELLCLLSGVWQTSLLERSWVTWAAATAARLEAQKKARRQRLHVAARLNQSAASMLSRLLRHWAAHAQLKIKRRHKICQVASCCGRVRLAAAVKAWALQRQVAAAGRRTAGATMAALTTSAEKRSVARAWGAWRSDHAEWREQDRSLKRLEEHILRRTLVRAVRAWVGLTVEAVAASEMVEAAGRWTRRRQLSRVLLSWEKRTAARCGARAIQQELTRWAVQRRGARALQGWQGSAEACRSLRRRVLQMLARRGGRAMAAAFHVWALTCSNTELRLGQTASWHARMMTQAAMAAWVTRTKILLRLQQRLAVHGVHGRRKLRGRTLMAWRQAAHEAGTRRARGARLAGRCSQSLMAGAHRAWERRAVCGRALHTLHAELAAWHFARLMAETTRAWRVVTTVAQEARARRSWGASAALRRALASRSTRALSAWAVWAAQRAAARVERELGAQHALLRMWHAWRGAVRLLALVRSSGERSKMLARSRALIALGGHGLEARGQHLHGMLRGWRDLAAVRHAQLGAACALQRCHVLLNVWLAWVSLSRQQAVQSGLALLGTGMRRRAVNTPREEQAGGAWESEERSPAPGETLFYMPRVSHSDAAEAASALEEQTSPMAQYQVRRRSITIVRSRRRIVQWHKAYLAVVCLLRLLVLRAETRDKVVGSHSSWGNYFLLGRSLEAWARRRWAKHPRADAIHTLRRARALRAQVARAALSVAFAAWRWALATQLRDDTAAQRGRRGPVRAAWQLWASVCAQRGAKLVLCQALYAWGQRRTAEVTLWHWASVAATSAGTKRVLFQSSNVTAGVHRRQRNMQRVGEVFAAWHGLLVVRSSRDALVLATLQCASRARAAAVVAAWKAQVHASHCQIRHMDKAAVHLGHRQRCTVATAWDAWSGRCAARRNYQRMVRQIHNTVLRVGWQVSRRALQALGRHARRQRRIRRTAALISSRCSARQLLSVLAAWAARAALASSKRAAMQRCALRQQCYAGQTALKGWCRVVGTRRHHAMAEERIVRRRQRWYTHEAFDAWVCHMHDAAEKQVRTMRADYGWTRFVLIHAMRRWRRVSRAGAALGRMEVSMCLRRDHTLLHAALHGLGGNAQSACSKRQLLGRLAQRRGRTLEAGALSGWLQCLSAANAGRALAAEMAAHRERSLQDAAMTALSRHVAARREKGALMAEMDSRRERALRRQAVIAWTRAQVTCMAKRALAVEMGSLREHNLQDAAVSALSRHVAARREKGALMVEMDTRRERALRRQAMSAWTRAQVTCMAKRALVAGMATHRERSLQDAAMTAILQHVAARREKGTLMVEMDSRRERALRRQAVTAWTRARVTCMTKRALVAGMATHRERSLQDAAMTAMSRHVAARREKGTLMAEMDSRRERALRRQAVIAWTRARVTCMAKRALAVEMGSLREHNLQDAAVSALSRHVAARREKGALMVEMDTRRERALRRQAMSAWTRAQVTCMAKRALVAGMATHRERSLQDAAMTAILQHVAARREKGTLMVEMDSRRERALRRQAVTAWTRARVTCMTKRALVAGMATHRERSLQDAAMTAMSRHVAARREKGTLMAEMDSRRERALRRQAVIAWTRARVTCMAKRALAVEMGSLREHNLQDAAVSALSQHVAARREKGALMVEMDTRRERALRRQAMSAWTRAQTACTAKQALVAEMNTHRENTLRRSVVLAWYLDMSIQVCKGEVLRCMVQHRGRFLASAAMDVWSNVLHAKDEKAMQRHRLNRRKRRVLASAAVATWLRSMRTSSAEEELHRQMADHRAVTLKHGAMCVWAEYTESCEEKRYVRVQMLRRRHRTLKAAAVAGWLQRLVERDAKEAHRQHLGRRRRRVVVSRAMAAWRRGVVAGEGKRVGREHLRTMRRRVLKRAGLAAWRTATMENTAERTGHTLAVAHCVRVQQQAPLSAWRARCALQRRGVEVGRRRHVAELMRVLGQWRGACREALALHHLTERAEADARVKSLARSMHAWHEAGERATQLKAKAATALARHHATTSALVLHAWTRHVQHKVQDVAAAVQQYHRRVVAVVFADWEEHVGAMKRRHAILHSRAVRRALHQQRGALMAWMAAAEHASLERRFLRGARRRLARPHAAEALREWARITNKSLLVARADAFASAPQRIRDPLHGWHAELLFQARRRTAHQEAARWFNDHLQLRALPGWAATAAGRRELRETGSKCAAVHQTAAERTVMRAWGYAVQARRARIARVARQWQNLKALHDRQDLAAAFGWWVEAVSAVSLARIILTRWQADTSTTRERNAEAVRSLREKWSLQHLHEDHGQWKRLIRGWHEHAHVLQDRSKRLADTYAAALLRKFSKKVVVQWRARVKLCKRADRLAAKLPWKRVRTEFLAWRERAQFVQNAFFVVSVLQNKMLQALAFSSWKDYLMLSNIIMRRTWQHQIRRRKVMSAQAFIRTGRKLKKQEVGTDCELEHLGLQVGLSSSQVMMSEFQLSEMTVENLRTRLDNIHERFLRTIAREFYARWHKHFIHGLQLMQAAELWEEIRLYRSKANSFKTWKAWTNAVKASTIMHESLEHIKNASALSVLIACFRTWRDAIVEDRFMLYSRVGGGEDSPMGPIAALPRRLTTTALTHADIWEEYHSPALQDEAPHEEKPPNPTRPDDPSYGDLEGLLLLDEMENVDVDFNDNNINMTPDAILKPVAQKLSYPSTRRKSVRFSLLAP
ncbi:hypothetical protein CYMTET_55647 [Cymbomonas tetramitiformis]|uniref:Sfi1 spindle body domain-containing protein n=1 Tax=Cymbomonas tetramitiformis TaxID=36881 RepID=A0AAE0BCX2_9CHLO|nr:hypothetical protein CYMTET_55647 [Cymbomonas tetramitiformis]